jgi:membrane protein YqaA with SNARE-associated domain
MIENAGGNEANRALSPGAPDDSESPRPVWKLRRWIQPALAILFVIIVSVGLFLLTKSHPDLIERFKTLGYVGVFVISLLSCATVVLPIPGVFAFIPLISQFDPVLVGVIGAAGGSIGEITGYMAGYGGRGLAGRGRLYARVEEWMRKRGSWVIFLISALFWVDVAGVVAGALRFPVWKFMLFMWLGKTIKYVAVMLFVSWGWSFIARWLGAA